MSGFAKLSSSIVLSTVWREPHHVRIVWVTMLALADASGYVGASVPGLADVSRVTLPECEEALRCFLSPDPYSRTTTSEGRRIEVLPGGWRLLNYDAYRAGRDPETRRQQNREAQQTWRDKHHGKRVSRRKPSVSRGQPESAQAEAEAEAEADLEADLLEGERVCVPEHRAPNEAATKTHTHGRSSSRSRSRGHRRCHPKICRAHGAPLCLDAEHVGELAGAVVGMPEDEVVRLFAAFVADFCRGDGAVAYPGDVFKRGRELFECWQLRLGNGHA